jgi:hypothetical protein
MVKNLEEWTTGNVEIGGIWPFPRIDTENPSDLREENQAHTPGKHSFMPILRRTLASGTRTYFGGSPGWWRPRYTPANASWLNQAEILIHAFKHYYLKRASWESQEEFKTHVLASWPEYNHRYAHPFEWTWTNQKMRSWFAKHAL